MPGRVPAADVPSCRRNAVPVRGLQYSACGRFLLMEKECDSVHIFDCRSAASMFTDPQVRFSRPSFFACAAGGTDVIR